MCTTPFCVVRWPIVITISASVWTSVIQNNPSAMCITVRRSAKQAGLHLTILHNSLSLSTMFVIGKTLCQIVIMLRHFTKWLVDVQNSSVLCVNNDCLFKTFVNDQNVNDVVLI